MPFVLSTRIRFVDTDASTRIHFSAMLRYFEAAEQEFLRSLGHEFSNLEGAGLGFPRVHVECTYTSMVRYDDLMQLLTPLEIEQEDKVRADNRSPRPDRLTHRQVAQEEQVRHGDVGGPVLWQR